MPSCRASSSGKPAAACAAWRVQQALGDGSVGRCGEPPSPPSPAAPPGARTSARGRRTRARRPAAGRPGRSGRPEPGAGGQRDQDVRLVGLDLQLDGLGVRIAGVQHRQVAAVQAAVPLDTGIDSRQPGRTEVVPDQFSAVKVVSRPARCWSLRLTRRRWTTLVRRPSRSCHRRYRVRSPGAGSAPGGGRGHPLAGRRTRGRRPPGS